MVDPKRSGGRSARRTASAVLVGGLALAPALLLADPPPTEREAPGAALAAARAPGAGSRARDASDPARARLAAVLEQYDQTQATTRTLQASFVERKELKLLKDPVVSKGRFFYTKPDDVLLEYTEPEVRYLLFTRQEQLFYSPSKKKAERGTSARVHDYIFRFLAIGQNSETLKKIYDISLDEAGNPLADTHMLVLQPRKRVVKRVVRDVRLWISRDRFLPVKIEWRESDGDSTTLTFEEVRFNPEIQAGVYRIDLPEDVEVIKRRVPGASEYAEKEEG